MVAAACSGGDVELDFDPAAAPTVPSPEAAAGEITISADSARPLDRRLFGTNVPAWLGPDRLAYPAFLASTVALGTTLLRFPGGSLEQRLRLARLRAWRSTGLLRDMGRPTQRLRR